MKPPSTVEARVAEELRNWLSSELEQLDASNTNQFAHHVVTILLHEDLDIEDEPLSAGDDFLRDIYSIRRGKTRDKQKKAAVQFLRSAVCCDPGEAEIQGVVDELMVKIEETKIRMNSKCSPKRISANGRSSFRQPGTRSDSHDRERLYNEAFPSLLHSSSSSNSSCVWHRLAVTASDTSHDVVSCRLPPESAHRVLVFDSQEEAHACNTARRVFVSTLPETTLPSFEATEVFASSESMASLELYSLNDAYRCWSTQSAFQACSLLRKFLPTTSPLKAVSQLDVRHGSLKDFSPTIIPVINQSDLQSISLDPSYEKTLTDHPQLFRPIKERSHASDFKDTPLSETDLEVYRIFNSSKRIGKLIKHTFDKPESPALMCTFDGGGGCTSCDFDRASTTHHCLREGTSTEGGELFGFVVGRVSSADEKLDKAEVCNISAESTSLGLTEAQSSDPNKQCDLESQDVKCCTQKLWDISCNCRQTSEIDDVRTFPHHDGGFWKLLADAGSMALYPVVSNQLVLELEDKFQAHQKFAVSPFTSYQALSARSADDLTERLHSADVTSYQTLSARSADDLTERVHSSDMTSNQTLSAKSADDLTERVHCGNVTSQQTVSTRSADDLTECVHCGDVLADAAFGHWMLESACVQVQYHYAVRQIAHVQQIPYWRQTTLRNPFMPSLLSSCLSTEGSQILQRAFVNSYFSDLFQHPMHSTQDKLAGVRCSDLEHCWLSTELLQVGGVEQANTEVVPGCTCSSWLENNCHLGDVCPFSHPSI
ncbi:hypothetical protein BsWGS_00960 [Bradybaena similaris]